MIGPRTPAERETDERDRIRRAIEDIGAAPRDKQDKSAQASGGRVSADGRIR